VKINISEQGFRVQSTETKILGNKYEPKVILEDKVYLETYYRHQQGVLQWMKLRKKSKYMNCR
jgi:hypothetical protein